MTDTEALSPRVLWIGDLLAYVIITLIGFSSHGSLELAALLRMLATFGPFYASWLIFSTWAGVHRRLQGPDMSWLLRSGLAALLSAPLGATLRGFWLGTPILPIFVLVMGLVSMLGIIVWRGLYVKLIRSREET